MTLSTDEPTTSLPAFIDMAAVLPELSSPQERYDHGFKRGYVAGYAEGARQAQAERAAGLAAQKTAWASTQARAAALMARLASATEEYVARLGPRDLGLTTELLEAAFELAEAVVGYELATKPGRALEVARALLAELPTGPAVVRVNPADKELLLAEPEPLVGSLHQQVSVVADASLAPGECVVTCGAKTADARVEEALQRARQVFCAPGAAPGAAAGAPGEAIP